MQNMTTEERKRRLDYCSKLKEKVSSLHFAFLFRNFTSDFSSFHQEALLKLQSHLQSQLESVNGQRREDITDEDNMTVL